MEVAVVVGLLAVLMGLGASMLSRHRAHSAVNSAAELAEGMLVRAREEAKAFGVPLPSELRASGLIAPSPAGGVRLGGPWSLRLRKRSRAGQPAVVVSQRSIPQATPLQMEWQGTGVLDLDGETQWEGVFLEVVTGPSEAPVRLATIPVDVNGELVLLAGARQARWVISFHDYSRTLEITERGVVVPDRR